jgi:predicted unusual protein kinase regulating ubiquinone biosynthesis (AarF/ABC1/UbiB family)
MNLWLALAVVAAILVLVPLASPIVRRVWVFHLHLVKYALLWLADVVGLRRVAARLRGEPYERLRREVAMRRLCEDLGPTFLKFGQIVASSAGMFPPKYVAEFQKVLDRVRPFGFEEVQAIVAAELGAEKAARLVNIGPTPLASASIAQVHTAELDDGTRLVIKVQRPRLERRIDADIRVMKLMASLASKLFRDRTEFVNPVGFVEDFSTTLREEIDFRKEAQNLDRFSEIMRELGYEDIRAPVPQWELTTRRILVMERFDGTRVDDAAGIRSRGYDGEELLVRGLKAWFQCVLFYGFFHGDVHAGNLMVLDDGDLGFLDFGIVGRFDERQRHLVTDYIVSFAVGDYKTLARVIVEMGGVASKQVDLPGFEQGLKETYDPMRTMAFGQVNYADFIPKINEVARLHRMTMPKEFILITKQMLYFDRYAKILAPTLNVFTDQRLVMSLMADVMKARSAAGTSEARA